MEFSPRTVFIPLTSGKPNGGRVARVQADAVPPAPHAAGLNARIAELSDWGLYPAGAFALGAIQRLGLAPRGIALLQRFQPGTIRSYLRVTNGPDLLGLAPENSRSAELGLALALLMHAGQSAERMVIASGSLGRGTAPQAVSDDVAIEAVGGIASKIEALVAALRIHRGGAFASKVLFFLPAVTLEGKDTVAAHAKDLADLKTAFASEGIEIEAVPVSSLREAISRLDITGLQPTPIDRLLARSAAVALALIVLAGAAHLWISAPLDLRFEDVELSDGKKVLSPVRAAYDAKAAAFEMRAACMGAQRLPVYRQGESLVLRAGLRNRHAVDRMLGGFHFTIVGVSEHSGIKIFPPQAIASAARLRSGVDTAAPRFGPDELSIVLPIDGPAERNKLIILARRLWPFDTRELRSTLEEALAEKPVTERINIATGHLSRLAPGYLEYSFLSAEGEPACEPR